MRFSTTEKLKFRGPSPHPPSHLICPACPSAKSNMQMKIVWSIGGMILTGETEVLGEQSGYGPLLE